MRRALAGAALGTAVLLAAPAVRAATLAEAVAQALQTNPRIQAARTGAQATRFDITAADAQLNTRYGLIAQPGYGYVRGGTDGAVGDLGVQAVKPIYDGGRTENDVARQTARLAAANQRTELARADVALRVADAYVEVVKQARLAGLAEAYVAAIASLRDKVREIVRLDRGRGYDLLQTESRLQQARLQLSSRDGARREALASLSQLVGAPIDGVTTPEDPPEAAETLDRALAALDDHPSIAAARADVEAARRAAAVANAWNKPVVSVRGAVNSPEVTIGDRRWLGGYQVGLVTDWNPFDGGAGEARAAAARAQVRAAEENVDAVRRDLSAEVTRHWTQIQTRRGRIGSLDELVAGAAKVRAAYWEQFQIGKRSIIDLLNAENETYLAQVSAATELAELLQVRYRLVGTQAVLTSQLGIEAPAPVPPPPTEHGPAERAAPARGPGGDQTVGQ
ncbi:MAG: TolC family protein [Lautropia sp.]